MNVVALEILVIILLLLANGVFAMSEIAVVSARRVRLQQRAAAGDLNALAALNLAKAPDRFLSTVQIGITLIGILAGAFGGATVAGMLAQQFSRVQPLAPYSEALSLGVVVVCITYLSLIIGELVPKRLALNNPERIAARVARPMQQLSRLAAPAVALLSVSTKLLLRLLRVRPSNEPPVTEEEIRVLINQGTEAGVFEAAEQELFEHVLHLADQRIPLLMTPRLKIEWLDISAPSAELRQRVISSRYSRLPVCQGTLDNILGVVVAKDLLARALAGEPLDLRAALRQPLYVPETRTALQLLELFRQSPARIAMVVDEHGALEGLVTMYDVLEAIVGELPETDGQCEVLAIEREDGSWLLDGRLPLAEFRAIYQLGRLSGEDTGAYHTLAGFVLAQLGRLPVTAETFVWNDLKFEIVDMDRRRVDRILVTRMKPS